MTCFPLSGPMSGPISGPNSGRAQTSMAGIPETVLKLPGGFSGLVGWDQADHAAAFVAFQASCRKLLENPPHERQLRLAPEHLLGLCPPSDDFGPGRTARDFFETHFDPVVIRDGDRERAGFFTAYFEPTVAASRTRTERFPVPLYRRPHDLARAKDVDLPDDWDPELSFAQTGPDGVRPYPDRAEIEGGYLKGRGLELAYVGSWAEAFFIHVQGSAQLRFADGSVMRLGYAAKNGWPFTSIGRLLIAAGTIDRATMTMPVLRRWLEDNPEEGLALMRKNASFIFFREVLELQPGDGPVGAAGIPLQTDISLAVDRTWHLFGTPVWVDVEADGTAVAGESESGSHGNPWQGHRGLMIAQDTGSAIVGPTRADLFLGTGPDAGAKAGLVKHAGRFVILWPKPAGGHGTRP